MQKMKPITPKAPMTTHLGKHFEAVAYIRCCHVTVSCHVRRARMIRPSQPTEETHNGWKKLAEAAVAEAAVAR